MTVTHGRYMAVTWPLHMAVKVRLPRVLGAGDHDAALLEEELVRVELGAEDLAHLRYGGDVGEMWGDVGEIWEDMGEIYRGVVVEGGVHEWAELPHHAHRVLHGGGGAVGAADELLVRVLRDRLGGYIWRLQAVTGGYMRLQAVTGGYRLMNFSFECPAIACNGR